MACYSNNISFVIYYHNSLKFLKPVPDFCDMAAGSFFCPRPLILKSFSKNNHQGQTCHYITQWYSFAFFCSFDCCVALVRK